VWGREALKVRGISNISLIADYPRGVCAGEGGIGVKESHSPSVYSLECLDKSVHICVHLNNDY
jgi:hypothetical protein